ncbi:hypothetical protein Taro_050122 [Colocasia esculenta]|uniref:Uncharacterized protein n=1 Tax=Colocasia esculenta TaxID=4460 RepID=A0A843XCZ0_COLES|nr:hypothetical protein [Colocasia esculenta]
MCSCSRRGAAKEAPFAAGSRASVVEEEPAGLEEISVSEKYAVVVPTAVCLLQQEVCLPGRVLPCHSVCSSVPCSLPSKIQITI